MGNAMMHVTGVCILIYVMTRYFRFLAAMLETVMKWHGDRFLPKFTERNGLESHITLLKGSCLSESALVIRVSSQSSGSQIR